MEAGSHQSSPDSSPTQSSVWGGGSDGIGLGLVAGRVRWRWDRIGFNGSALHVGDQLVGDLSQHVFGQPRHAQHMVTCAVHVVSEWHKLLWNRTDVYVFLYFL